MADPTWCIVANWTIALHEVEAFSLKELDIIWNFQGVWSDTYSLSLNFNSNILIVSLANFPSVKPFKFKIIMLWIAQVSLELRLFFRSLSDHDDLNIHLKKASKNCILKNAYIKLKKTHGSRANSSSNWLFKMIFQNIPLIFQITLWKNFLQLKIL